MLSRLLGRTLMPSLLSPLRTIKTTRKGGVAAFRGYSLNEAIKLVKAYATRAFDESVRLTVMTSCDPRKQGQLVRGATTLPFGTGKKIRVAVFAKDAKAEEARNAGADIVGGQDLADQVTAGKIDFDRCIATPDMMGIVGKVARILGPKGLMPNPKMGTVTNNVKEAVEASKKGLVEFKSNKLGQIGVICGKASFPATQLVANVEAILQRLRELKPETVPMKTYFVKVTVSSSMGPGAGVDMTPIIT